MIDLVERLPAASFHLILLSVVLLLLGRLPGAWRAWGWRLAMAKTMILLAGAIALPLLPAEPLPLTEEPLPEVGETLSLSGGVQRSTIPWIELGWMGMALALGARLLIRIWVTTKLARMSKPVPDAWPSIHFERVEVRVLDGLTAPMVVGLVRPVVLLPNWPIPPIGWKAALAHEVAHARRQDLIWDAFAQAFACLFWFHPLAWLAVREHRMACEEASDAAALAATGSSVSAYANTLVDLGRPLTGGLALGAPARALYRRIRAMHRRPFARFWAIPFFALAMGLAAPIHLTAAEPQTSVPSSPRFDHVAASMLGRPSVIRELRLDSEILAKIRDPERAKRANQRLRAIGNAVAAMKERGATAKEIAEFEGREKERHNNEWTREYLALLTSAQTRRLRQIALQRYGPLALHVPPIARAAGVSETTRKRISDIRNELRRDMIRRQQEEFRRNREHYAKGTGLPEAERQRYLRLERRARGGGFTIEEWKEYTSYRERIGRSIGLPSVNSNLPHDREAWIKHTRRVEALLTPTERRGWQRLLGKPVPADPRESHFY